MAPARFWAAVTVEVLLEGRASQVVLVQQCRGRGAGLLCRSLAVVAQGGEHGRVDELKQLPPDPVAICPTHGGIKERGKVSSGAVLVFYGGLVDGMVWVAELDECRQCQTASVIGGCEPLRQDIEDAEHTGATLGHLVVKQVAPMLVVMRKNGDDKVVLAREVPVERRPANPGGIEDLLHADSADTLRREQLARGFEETFPSLACHGTTIPSCSI